MLDAYFISLSAHIYIHIYIYMCIYIHIYIPFYPHYSSAHFFSGAGVRSGQTINPPGIANPSTAATRARSRPTHPGGRDILATEISWMLPLDIVLAKIG